MPGKGPDRFFSFKFCVAYEEVERRKQSEVKRSSSKNDKSSHLSQSNDGSGNSTNHPMIDFQKTSIDTSTSNEKTFSQNIIARAFWLIFSTLSISLQRVDDKNVWPLVHVSLVFLWSFTLVDKAMKYVERSVSWSGICSFFNILFKSEVMTAARIEVAIAAIGRLSEPWRLGTCERVQAAHKPPVE